MSHSSISGWQKYSNSVPNGNQQGPDCRNGGGGRGEQHLARSKSLLWNGCWRRSQGKAPPPFGGGACALAPPPIGGMAATSCDGRDQPNFELWVSGGLRKSCIGASSMRQDDVNGARLFPTNLLLCPFRSPDSMRDDSHATLDSTGMFHWCEPVPFEQAVLVCTREREKLQPTFS